MLNIQTDSRKVKKGDTFVAIVGEVLDGHDYIESAIKNGASKIVVSKDLNYGVDTLVVSDTTKYLDDYLINNYSDKINSINLVGVTGTNGKTTTCYLAYQMLKKLHKKVAYIGTIGFYYGDTFKTLNNTTPGVLDLYNMILEAIDYGCDTVVMEISSHALVQNRIAGLKYKTVAFTNLTQDHLDYHKTMDNYLNAKLKILDYLKKDGVSIANIDDEAGVKFLIENSKSISFKNGDYKILDYIDNGNKMTINFSYDNKDYNVDVNLKSKFNVYNYIMCVAIVHSLGISINDILKVTKDIYPPKGRCEQFPVNNGIAVVDYAHTPDAVLKIIEAFSENKKGRIITIVGCGGDRDNKKRPIMGNIATENSDYVIFTDDNPRTEDNHKIMKDIIDGVNKDNYEVIYDRKEAILKGLSLINKNDVLLVLGKGHEDYQIIGTTKHHFDDSEIIKEAIK